MWKIAEAYIKASTTNGGIEITGTTGIDDLTTTNVAITAEIFDILDDINIHTIYGGITIYIKPTLNSSIQASTVNGGNYCWYFFYFGHWIIK
jgi:hypothetical protein